MLAPAIEESAIDRFAVNHVIAGVAWIHRKEGGIADEAAR